MIIVDSCDCSGVSHMIVWMTICVWYYFQRSTSVIVKNHFAKYFTTETDIYMMWLAAVASTFFHRIRCTHLGSRDPSIMCLLESIAIFFIFHDKCLCDWVNWVAKLTIPKYQQLNVLTSHQVIANMSSWEHDFPKFHNDRKWYILM